MSETEKIKQLKLIIEQKDKEICDLKVKLDEARREIYKLRDSMTR